MKTVIVVYSELPEMVNFYVIEPKTQEEYDRLLSWHDTYIGMGYDDEYRNGEMQDDINDYFYDRECGLRFKDRGELPIDIENAVIIRTGIIL